MTTTPESRAGSRLDALAHYATVVAVFGLGGMVACQGWQVFARYALNASPSWTEPLTLFFLSTTLAFGAAAGVHSGNHFSFPLLVRLLPPPVQRACARLSALIVVLTGLLLAGYGGWLFLADLDVRLAGAPLPQSIAFLPLALGGALMAAFAVPSLIHPVTEA
jgi:TRAP-type C4-dicarboxylate transport system permease small subunit